MYYFIIIYTLTNAYSHIQYMYPCPNTRKCAYYAHLTHVTNMRKHTHTHSEEFKAEPLKAKAKFMQDQTF